MLLYARDNENMFHYLLAKFTDKYINPEIMGQDKCSFFCFLIIFLFQRRYAMAE